MKALLIAEKPSLMRAIKDVYQKNKGSYGFEIDFLAQAGHLVGLKMPDEVDAKYGKWKLDNFPIDVDYIYKVLPGKSNLVNDIRKALKSGNYDFVIHAGDPDGEGQLLVDLVLQYAGNTLPVKRFWSNDITPGAIDAALKSIKDNKDYTPIFDAALVRQHLDYQFGMNLTGVATLKAKKFDGAIRLGRVKAPIIKMIVDREREIINFVDSSKFKESFLYKDCEFVGEAEYDSEAKAKAALPTGDSALVTKVEEKNTKKKAPKLYKLSTLQTDAHNRYKLSGKATLALVQSLYEKQLVSYPRTDCEYISSHENLDGVFKSVAPLFLTDTTGFRTGAAVGKDKDYANDAKVATEGHTALIPTGKKPVGLSKEESAIYELIARRFLAIFAPEKEIHSISVTAEADKKPFVYQGREDIVAGYELVLNPAYKKTTMPKVAYKNGDVLCPVEFKVKEIKAKPPVRFNDGSLVKALDTPEGYKDANGKSVKYKIGTPATRANIIDECIKCGYFIKEKGAFVPTDLAFYTIDTFGDVSMFDITTSAKWEEDFELIRGKEKKAADVEGGIMKELRTIVGDLKAREVTPIAKGAGPGGKGGSGVASLDIDCPCGCGGKVTENSKAFSCTNWNAPNKCGFTIWKNNTALKYKISAADVKKFLAGKEVEKNMTSKAGKKWKQKIFFDKSTGKVEFVARDNSYER